MKKLLETIVTMLSLPLTSPKDDLIAELQNGIQKMRKSGEAETQENFIKLTEAVISNEKAFREKLQGTVPLKDVASVLELKADADFSTIKGTITALKNPTGFVPREEFDALKGQVAEKEANELVDNALKEGKITPAQKDWALNYAKADPKAFEVFVANQLAQVPVQKRPGYEPPAQNRRPITDEVQMKINKMLGIDDDTFQKYGPKAEA